MKLIWHCHACFELISADGSVVFDPYSPGSVRGLELNPLRADCVICSHGHSDHNYTDGVELSGIEPGFSLTQVPTYHDGKLGALRGDNLCSVVEAESMRIAHLGDLGHTLDPETAAKLKPLDVLMIPVGGYYTICPQQAKEIAIALDAKTIIPMHYRGAGIGLENVAYVDDFLALWDDDDIVYLPGCEYEVKPSAKRLWGDRIFEKCGIGRDEGGDGGKTLEIRGKRRLSARDGGANYQQS